MAWKQTLQMRAWAFLKVPLIGYVRPRIEHVDDDEARIVIPLRRRTKNHWNTMYFGALAVGADVAAGVHALHATNALRNRDGTKVGFVFKDIKGEFTRRPDADVTFTSSDGAKVAKAVAKAAASGDRVNVPVPVTCTAGGHEVAHFTLTLSLKRT